MSCVEPFVQNQPSIWKPVEEELEKLLLGWGDEENSTKASKNNIELNDERSGMQRGHPEPNALLSQFSSKASTATAMGFCPVPSVFPGLTAASVLPYVPVPPPMPPMGLVPFIPQMVPLPTMQPVLAADQFCGGFLPTVPSPGLFIPQPTAAMLPFTADRNAYGLHQPTATTAPTGLFTFMPMTNPMPMNPMACMMPESAAAASTASMMMCPKIYCVVEFKRGRTLQYESATYIAPGEYVIVGGDRGEDLGMVVYTWMSQAAGGNNHSASLSDTNSSPSSASTQAGALPPSLYSSTSSATTPGGGASGGTSNLSGSGSFGISSEGMFNQSESSSNEDSQHPPTTAEGDPEVQFDNFGNPVALNEPMGIGRVIRRATAKEVQHLHTVQAELEKRCVEVCQRKVHEYGLIMNVIDAEYQFDRKKLTFYYDAAERQDFRDLVRDLYKLYRARIWMSKVAAASATSSTTATTTTSSAQVSSSPAVATIASPPPPQSQPTQTTPPPPPTQPTATSPASGSKDGTGDSPTAAHSE